MTGKVLMVPTLFVFLACALVAQTKQEGAPEAPEKPTPEAPKKPSLGAWWRKNALEYDPLPARWLFHVEGTLSYMNASGNTTGSSFDASASVYARKARTTSVTFLEQGRRNLVYGFGEGSVDYSERTLREQVDFAVHPAVKLVAGVEAYRNTLMFMDGRLTGYGGVGAVPFQREKQQLTFTGGAGYSAFDFDRARMLTVNPARTALLDTQPSSGGALIMQTWHWTVSHRFSFFQDATYMEYFRGYLGHRWAINLSGSFPINKILSFDVSYRLREEKNDIIGALGLSPRDRSVTTGIKVSI
jgi:hypothetical protein